MRLIALLALMTCSCSFLGMKQVPTNHRVGTPLKCTDSKGLVALDGGLSFGYVVVGILAEGLASLGDYSEENNHTVGPALILVGLVHLTSALAGNIGANKCRKAKAANKAATVPPKAPVPPGPPGSTAAPEPPAML